MQQIFKIITGDPMQRLFIFCIFFLCLYFFIGAYLLHEKMPKYLFPHITQTNKTNEFSKYEFYDSATNGVVIREYGQSNTHCLIFFPGQHGGAGKYEDDIFTIFQKNNFKVFSISYPGQDGAKGEVEDMASLIALINEAMIKVSSKCSPKSTIAYGRSLGATVAAFSIVKEKISGMILESVAPSLSLAVRNHLKSKWYLTPLTLLPISKLLPNEYKLSDSFSLLKGTPIAIFQGTRDIKTPLKQLERTWNYDGNVSLHRVENGLHSNTHIKARNEIINVAKTMVLESTPRVNNIDIL